MKAVIMAGGFGKRLSPITDLMPKPMVPILNNPLIDYSVRLLHQAEIFEVGIGLGFMPEAIIDFLNLRYGRGVFKFNIECNPLGTAGCVKRFEDFLDGEAVAVISGDALTDIDLQEMYAHHRAAGNLVTIAVKTVDDPSGFGVAVIDKSGRITDFQEKPPKGKELSRCVSTGIYILESSVLSLVPEDCPYDFAHDLFPVLLAKDMRIGAYGGVNYWSDVGTPAGFFYANMDALCGKLDFNAFYGGLNDILDIAESRAGSISRNVVLHGGVTLSEEDVLFSNTVTGRSVTAAPGVIIANAVVLEGTHLTESAVNCIAGAFGQIPVPAQTAQSTVSDRAASEFDIIID